RLLALPQGPELLDGLPARQAGGRRAVQRHGAGLPASSAMTHLDAVHLLALAAALGLASGPGLFLTVLLVGIAGHWGWIALPPGLQVLASPLVMSCAAALGFIEFLADKIPLVDSAWDALHTLIRIPAGAALVAGLFSGWAGGHGEAWT